MEAEQKQMNSMTRTDYSMSLRTAGEYHGVDEDMEAFMEMPDIIHALFVAPFNERAHT
jgi:hypothetical protein